ERGGGAGLALEALDVVCGDRAVEDLDRDGPLEIALDGGVHRAIAAAPEPLADQVTVAEHAPGELAGHRRRFHHAHQERTSRMAGCFAMRPSAFRRSVLPGSILCQGDAPLGCGSATTSSSRPCHVVRSTCPI